MSNDARYKIGQISNSLELSFKCTLSTSHNILNFLSKITRKLLRILTENDGFNSFLRDCQVSPEIQSILNFESFTKIKSKDLML